LCFSILFSHCDESFATSTVLAVLGIDLRHDHSFLYRLWLLQQFRLSLDNDGISFFYGNFLGLEWLAVFVFGSLDVLLLAIQHNGISKSPHACRLAADTRLMMF
jgi:hypothetical protein